MLNKQLFFIILFDLFRSNWIREGCTGLWKTWNKSSGLLRDWASRANAQRNSDSQKTEGTMERRKRTKLRKKCEPVWPTLCSIQLARPNLESFYVACPLKSCTAQLLYTCIYMQDTARASNGFMRNRRLRELKRNRFYDTDRDMIHA